MQSNVSLVATKGSGRTFVLIVEQGDYRPLAESVYQTLAEDAKRLLIELAPVTDTNWEQATNDLLALLAEQGVRQASFVSFGAAGVVVQNVCLYDIKLVRSVIFVDAATRSHPNLLTRIVDRIEQALPLGLPLRAITRGFDGKPFLQRIRCPVLVVTSQRASAHERAEADRMVQRFPTSWRSELAGAEEDAKLLGLVNDFQGVMAKCPQKNRVTS